MLLNSVSYCVVVDQLDFNATTELFAESQSRNNCLNGSLVFFELEKSLKTVWEKAISVKRQIRMSFEYNRQSQLLDIFNWRFYGKEDYEEMHQVQRVVISACYYFGD